MNCDRNGKINDLGLQSTLTNYLQTYLSLPNIAIRTVVCKNEERPVLADCSSCYKYWKENKENLELLFQLARAVFSVPCSRAEIERAFSDSSYFVSPRLCRISP